MAVIDPWVSFRSRQRSLARTTQCTRKIFNCRNATSGDARSRDQTGLIAQGAGGAAGYRELFLLIEYFGQIFLRSGLVGGACPRRGGADKSYLSVFQPRNISIFIYKPLNRDAEIS